jgi:hypothetical protein
MAMLCIRRKEAEGLSSPAVSGPAARRRKKKTALAITVLVFIDVLHVTDRARRMRDLSRQVNPYITWQEFRKRKIIPAHSTTASGE